MATPSLRNPADGIEHNPEIAFSPDPLSRTDNQVCKEAYGLLLEVRKSMRRLDRKKGFEEYLKRTRGAIRARLVRLGKIANRRDA